MVRRLAVGFAAAVCGMATSGALAAPASADLPVSYNSAVAIAATLGNPSAPPPGANDWSCSPGAAHPRPVVLVHGTFANRAVNWNALSPLLKNRGYCVFALNYGETEDTNGITYGLGPVAESAAELGAFVNRVLAATDAARVDIVGHSQGGMMPRYYLRFLGGAAKVRSLIGLAPSNHGTTLNGFGLLARLFPWTAQQTVGAWCRSCLDQIVGSGLLTQLNAGPDTVPGVRYTVIQTRNDSVVTPWWSAYLEGANNIVLQDGCWLDGSDHLSVAFNRIALRHVLNALDPANAVRPPCVPVLPVIGG